MPNNHVSRVSTDAKPSRTNLLIRRKSGVSLVKAVAIAAIIAACAVGVMAMLDGNRALTADEASRQALRAIVSAGVAIACAVLYAACSHPAYQTIQARAVPPGGQAPRDRPDGGGGRRPGAGAPRRVRPG